MAGLNRRQAAKLVQLYDDLDRAKDVVDKIKNIGNPETVLISVTVPKGVFQSSMAYPDAVKIFEDNVKNIENQVVNGGGSLNGR